MSVGVREGDYVDDVKVAKVWTTGKAELADGRSVHQRDLIFCAGANYCGARFTTRRPKMLEPRGPLPLDVERAARYVSSDAWGGRYQPGEGVMHYGGGPAHSKALRAKADRWERLADAARICADYLGDGEFPEAIANSQEDER